MPYACEKHFFFERYPRRDPEPEFNRLSQLHRRPFFERTRMQAYCGSGKSSDTKRSGPAAAHAHPHVLHGGSPGFESARNDEPFIVFGDAGQACRTAAAVRSTPTHNAGKRAQRFNASTSVHAFWLSRINNGVLCRVTDVASSEQLVDAGSGGTSERAFPACVAGGGWPAGLAGKAALRTQKGGPEGPPLRRLLLDYAQPLQRGVAADRGEIGATYWRVPFSSL